MGERSQGNPREAQHYLEARAPRESPSGAGPRGPHFAIPAAPGPATSDNCAPGRPITETAEVDALLAPAQRTHDSPGGIVNPTADAENPWAITPFELHELADDAGEQTVSHQGTPEVELDVRIELGRALVPAADVLKLRRGSVVPLGKLADEWVDIVVDNQLVARGEVLVLNDKFCVRVVELIPGENGA